MQIYGDIPQRKSIIFCSVDEKYFFNHAVHLASSVKQNTSKHLHIHIINPSEETIAKSLETKKEFDCTISYEDTDGNLDRVYYACNRFIVAPFFLEHVEHMLIVDADGFFLRDFDMPESSDFGLFLRDPLPGTQGLEHYGTHVAAGVVFYNNKAIELARGVSDVILQNQPLRWFIDQAALYNVYEQIVVNSDFSFYPFDQKWIDWEFKEDSIIWSGKGPRKDSEPYLSGRKKYS